ncbi:DUF455 family protein [Cohnella soli]|uniref:DUF455 family protein n=1 Tax=Cohnella soli TaxID=425005 RepID=A0ABW0I0A2_9BACL
MKRSRNDLRKIGQTETLRKIMSFQKELIPLAGAWLAKLPNVEAKYLTARHLYQWAAHVQAIRQRLKELPGGKPNAALHPALADVAEEMLFAQGEEAFLGAMYGTLLPAIRDGYALYMDDRHELPDRPTFALLKQIALELEEQIRYGQMYLERRQANTERDSDWAAHVRALLEAAGGILAEDATGTIGSLRRFAGANYAFSERPHRPEGAHLTNVFPIDGYEGSLLGGELLLERVALAIWLYNEMDAVEILGSVLYEVKGMPWEFYYDVARHTWDEARHSEFGNRLLDLFGFRPEEFETTFGAYSATMALAPHERYLAITHIYEPGSFQIKPGFLERLAAETDRTDLVLELLKFDLADETTHVKYGHKWAQDLLRQAGEERTVQEAVEQIGKRLEFLYADIAASFKRTMPEDRRHTTETVLRHMRQA